MSVKISSHVILRSVCFILFLGFASVLASLEVSEEREPVFSASKLPETFSCHTQGLSIYNNYLFTSCTQVLGREGYLLRYTLPHDFHTKSLHELHFEAAKVQELTFNGQHHTSGLDHDTQCIWNASADYRPFFANSEIMCIDPETLSIRSSFSFADHIGTLAVDGDALLLMNWGSKIIYRVSKTGSLLGEYSNPTGMAYQDCRGGESIHCIASHEVDGKIHTVIDRLMFDPAGKKLLHAQRRTFIHKDLNFGREGFTLLNEKLFVVPEDYPNARLLFIGKLEAE